MKFAEKVIVGLLPEVVKRRKLISDGQYGSRKMQLAINAAAMVVDRAHVAWMEGHITGVLLMDMKACVLSVGRGRLIHMISGKGTDRDLI